MTPYPLQLSNFNFLSSFKGKTPPSFLVSQMLFLKIAIPKQNKLSEISKCRIVAYLLQVIVSKFEIQGLKIAQLFKKVLPSKDLCAFSLTSLPCLLTSLPRLLTSLPCPLKGGRHAHF